MLKDDTIKQLQIIAACAQSPHANPRVCSASRALSSQNKPSALCLVSGFLAAKENKVPLKADHLIHGITKNDNSLVFVSIFHHKECLITKAAQPGGEGAWSGADRRSVLQMEIQWEIVFMPPPPFPWLGEGASAQKPPSRLTPHAAGHPLVTSVLAGRCWWLPPNADQGHQLRTEVHRKNLVV